MKRYFLYKIGRETLLIIFKTEFVCEGMFPPGADPELICTGERGWGDGKGVRSEEKTFEKKIVCLLLHYKRA